MELYGKIETDEIAEKAFQYDETNRAITRDLALYGAGIRMLYESTRLPMFKSLQEHVEKAQGSISEFPWNNREFVIRVLKAKNPGPGAGDQSMAQKLKDGLI